MITEEEAAQLKGEDYVYFINRQPFGYSGLFLYVDRVRASSMARSSHFINREEFFLTADKAFDFLEKFDSSSKF